MRKRVLFIFIILTLFTCLHAEARLFFIGSNPYLSKIAFPQDTLLIPSGFISYSLEYQSMPWWGDVDEPAKKPNNNYTSSSDSFTFANNSTDTQQSTFNKDGAVSVFKHTVDYLRYWSNGFNSMFSLNLKTMSMNSTASGNLRVTNDAGASLGYTSFDYELSNFSYMLYFESITSYKFGSVPVGLKLGFGREQFGDPESLLTANNYTVGALTSSRILWGWSTSGCKKIFGHSHINGDAWTQSDYSTGGVYQFDTQIGTTFELVKIGARYRYKTGVLDYYVWDTPASHLSGEYVRQKWSKELTEHIGRVYGNVNFYKNRKLKLNTLFFFGIDDSTQGNVYSQDNSIDSGVKESFTNFIVEANPNVNINFGKMFYIDIAVLLEFSWTNFENTYEQWISSVGGRKEVYWKTSGSFTTGEEQSWNEFSYANEHFYDGGWEVDLSIPLYGDTRHKLVFGAMIFHNNKFTFVTKYYGEPNTTDGSFTVTNKRYDEKIEMWVNSAVSLFYKYDEMFFRVTYIMPMVYNVTFSTKLVDSSETTLYESEKSMQTAVQESVAISHPTVQSSARLSFMVGYEF
ncbi:MAG: hypothetical protein GY754_38680 [bacterium]|nr:hypothetical protein [bacterium]